MKPEECSLSEWPTAAPSTPNRRPKCGGQTASGYSQGGSVLSPGNASNAHAALCIVTGTRESAIEKSLAIFAASLAVVRMVPQAANAAGCLKGAAVCGAASHHTALSAVGGCVIGHHQATLTARQKAASPRNVAPLTHEAAGPGGRSGGPSTSSWHARGLSAPARNRRGGPGLPFAPPHDQRRRTIRGCLSPVNAFFRAC